MKNKLLQLHKIKMPRKQKGFLIPLSLFIVLALSFFTITMSRMTSSSRTAAIEDGVSVQAFFAAESGAQWAMHTIYYNAGDRTTADANCVTVDSSNLNLSGTGFGACTVALTCTRTIDAGDTTSLYAIRSDASCGTQDILAERSISVSAYMR